MRVPWGSYFYTSGAWSNAVSSITVSGVAGDVNDIELVAAYGEISPSSGATATDGGGAYTYMGYAYAGIVMVTIYARLLTNTNTHSVTVSGSSWNPTGGARYRRLSVYIVKNPMRVSISDLAGMYKKVEYVDASGYGATTYFPDCTTLKTSGGFRLDIGVAWRQWDNTGAGASQFGNSFAPQSWPSPSPTGYQFSNGDGVSYNLGSASARCIEDVGRYFHSNSSLVVPWSDPNFGQIPYTNKCYNSSTGTYVSLSSFLGAFSFVIPNYGGTQMVL